MQAHFGDELKGGIHFIFGTFHSIGITVPGEQMGRFAKGIGPVAAERMPICAGKAQMIFHAFALDEFLGIVMSECERVFGFRTLVPYLGYILENTLHIRFEAYRSGSAGTIKYSSGCPAV